MLSIKRNKFVYLFASILICIYSNASYATTSTSPLLKPTDKTNAIWCKKLVIDQSKAQTIGVNPNTNLNCNQLGPNWVAIGFQNNTIGRYGRFAYDYNVDMDPPLIHAKVWPKGTEYNSSLNTVQLVCAPRVLEFTQGRCTQ